MGETKKLIGNSFIVFAGTMVASFFAYLFNMIMGRLLGPAQYGELTAIMSVLMIISVGGGAVLTVSMRYSGEAYSSRSFTYLGKILRIFSKFIFIFSILLFLAGVLLSSPVAKFFQINHVVPIIISFTGVIFGYLILINKGILQGTQKFKDLSWITILETGLKLGLGVLFVKIGYDLNGAVLAIVLATAIAYLFTFWPIITLLKRKDRKDNNTEFSLDKREIIAYALPTSLATLLLVGLINSDVILVKHYFPAEEAGLYAAVSTVAKIILYGTAPIVSVMFPMISEKRISGDKHYPLFLYSLLFTLFGALLVLGIYATVPAKVIGLLYGSSYTQFYYLLPEIGLFILFYTLVNLVTNYFLAMKNFIFLYIFSFCFAIQLIAIILWHPSLLAVVRVLIASTGLLFAAIMGYYLFTKKEQIRSFLQGNYGTDSKTVDNNSGV